MQAGKKIDFHVVTIAGEREEPRKSCICDFFSSARDGHGLEKRCLWSRNMLRLHRGDGQTLYTQLQHVRV